MKGGGMQNREFREPPRSDLTVGTLVLSTQLSLMCWVGLAMLIAL